MNETLRKLAILLLKRGVSQEVWDQLGDLLEETDQQDILHAVEVKGDVIYIPKTHPIMKEGL